MLGLALIAVFEPGTYRVIDRDAAAEQRRYLESERRELRAEGQRQLVFERRRQNLAAAQPAAEATHAAQAPATPAGPPADETVLSLPMMP
ncbi:MAG: hypothetical protein H7125_03580 [Proteobacteria bacterium]|nr:hypothetical protein [Burkholderiales bacterium]